MATDGVRFDIQGLEPILKKMRELGPELSKKGLRVATRKAANIVRDAARRNARTVDDSRTPENIAKNIVVKESGRQSKRVGGSVMRVGVMGGARDLTKHGEFKGAGKANPGGDTWYWRLLEFGTSKMAAKPFMRPALDANSDRATEVLVNELNIAIDKQIAKGPK